MLTFLSSNSHLQFIFEKKLLFYNSLMWCLAYFLINIPFYTVYYNVVMPVFNWSISFLVFCNLFKQNSIEFYHWPFSVIIFEGKG